MKKQTAKAQTIMNNLRNPETKSKIFYLSDIFKAVNELNLQLQGRKSDFVSCSQKIKGFMGKLKFWKKQVAKKNLSIFKNFYNTNPTSECIVQCEEHLDGLHQDFERRYADLLEMDQPPWFIDLANFEPDDGINPELAENLLDLKEDSKLVRRVEKEGVFGYIEVMESNPIVFKSVESSIMHFLQHGLWRQDFQQYWMFSQRKEVNWTSIIEETSD